jgi:ABC-type phosphate transport system substrate-binding protein
MQVSVKRLLIALMLFIGLESARAADEPMAIIIAPGHAKSLKKEELALIFKRKKLFWSDGTKIQPVNLPATNPLRHLFSQAILGASPEELEKYWNDVYFHGISPPFVLSSEQAVVHFVSETPGAIGYVSLCALQEPHVEIAWVMTTNGHLSDDPTSAACPK